MFNITESCEALYVRKRPIGSRIYVEAHTPAVVLTRFSSTSFSPESDTTYHITKNNTEITAGVPNPPFLMIAPSGAPIRKKTRQATERVNFLFQLTS